MLDWRVLAEPPLNTGLHGSLVVMVDLHGSSGNMENLLRIRSEPANTPKETVQPFQTWMDQQGQGQGQGQVQEDLPDSEHHSLGPVGPQTTGQSQQQGHN